MGSNLIIVVIIFASIAFQVPLYQCPAFAVNTSLQTGVCAQRNYIPTMKNSYNWQFNNCSSGQICAFNPAQNTSKCVPLANSNSSLPGENCTINSDCLSKNCDNTTKRCIGKPQGAICTDTSQCSVGLFCSGNPSKQSCSPLIPISGSCANGGLCVGNAMCINNTCYGFQTVPYGGQADNYFLCKANYSVYPDSVNGINKCGSPLTLTNPSTQCDLATMCVYTGDNNYTKSIPCRCGINPTQNSTKGNCSYGSRDLTRYMDNFMNYTNSIWQGTPKCHINNPYFCSNAANETGYYQAYVGLQYFHDNLYLDSSTQNDVIKSILRSDYWSAYSKVPPPPPIFATSFSLIFSLFLALIILI